jgi:plasmid stabilization system protein ParE
MKCFKVRVSAAAKSEMRAAYCYIRRNSPANAVRWREGLLDAGNSLKDFPERCPLALEQHSSEFEIRQLVYGNYRLLFTILDDTVVILHIRHAARQPMCPEDIVPPAEF